MCRQGRVVLLRESVGKKGQVESAPADIGVVHVEGTLRESLGFRTSTQCSEAVTELRGEVSLIEVDEPLWLPRSVRPVERLFS